MKNQRLLKKLLTIKTTFFWALKDIDLTIYKGEKIGIFGPNGSGKTTLLKLITGVTDPSDGSIILNGRVVSIIDLEAGFHLDLNGAQNIMLNGLILGMSRREVEEKFHSIVEYSDIKRFIDVPLFTYSQGMLMRLSMSIALYARPDILIIDENFGVGDQDFRNKFYKSIRSKEMKTTTFIFVSHFREILKKFCSTFYLIQNSSLTKIHSKDLLSIEYGKNSFLI